MTTSSKPPPYSSTTESITVVWEGVSHTVKKGTTNFEPLRRALQEKRWDDVPKHLTVEESLSNWSDKKFKIGNNQVTYQGVPVPHSFGRRVLMMATKGESVTPLLMFYERLQRNPSKRSVDQLWDFLDHMKIPLTKDGCFLAYKGVRDDFKDVHSGKIDNKPGNTVELPRNSISDDPREACHFGLHVGAESYATGFGKTVVVCKVDPEHVVCVPYDHSHQKMRVCKYVVIGIAGGELSSTLDDRDEENWVEGEGQSQEDERNEIPDTEEEEDEESDKPVVVEKEKATVTKVKSDKKKPAAKITTPVNHKKSEFDKYKKFDYPELIELSLDELRKYATYGLDIVGASKIAGGKTALIGKILSVRAKL